MSFLAPHVMPPESVRARMTACLQIPMIFHGVQYAAKAHRNVIRGHSTEVDRRTMLVHKAETLRLLKGMISRIDDLSLVETELVIMTVILLFRDEEIAAAEASEGHAPLPFVPHVPSSCWLNVYGKTKTVAAHARALVTLVNRVGGIQSVCADLGRACRMWVVPSQ